MKKWIDLFIYKPNSKEIYWQKIYTIAGAIIILFMIVYYDNIRLANRKKERQDFTRYSIGITTAEHNNVKGSMVVDYDYFFAGSKYSNSNTAHWLFGKPNTHGGRYYVVFASLKPTNVVILWQYPVPDSVNVAPDSGWEYMPGYEKVKVVQ